jgi:geranylgeranyl pyrophosphate synthase
MEEEQQEQEEEEQQQQQPGDMRRRVRSVFDVLVHNGGRNVRRRVMSAQQEAFVGALIEHGAYVLELMHRDAFTADNIGEAVEDYHRRVGSTLHALYQ